jgi:hypothetical protein
MLATFAARIEDKVLKKRQFSSNLYLKNHSNTALYNSIKQLIMANFYKIILPFALLLLPSTYGYAQDTVPPLPAEAKTEVTLTEAGIKLYPNPVEAELRVESAKYDINRLAIYSSISGELVFSCLVPIPHGASIIINMSARASGYYVVRVWLKEVKKPVSCSVYKT